MKAVSSARRQRVSGLDVWVPRLVIIAAIVHMLIGVASAHEHWRGIILDGLWNTVASDDDGRMKALWFMFSGVALVVIGIQADRVVKLSGRLSAATGWMLVVLGLPVSILEPVSGGWSLIIIGVLALLAARQDPLQATKLHAS